MTTFKTSSAPYQRGKRTTLQIMIELGISLAVVWIAAIITTFVKLGTSYGVRSILLMLVALLTTALCDVLTTVLRNKKDKELPKKIVHDLVHNYSWITAMIFTLLCPVWTRYYVVIVGSIFATMIVKNVFGGFGNNIFNPAAFGRLFIQLCFGLAVPSDITSGVDPVTGATITSSFNSNQQWLGCLGIDGFSVKDILLGTYFGAMGEPFTILLLVIGIVLVVRGVINWRAPAFYLGTVTVTSLIIALVLGFENPFLYVLYHLGLGGLMFGAVFMITDPVTTPTSPFGNCLIGVVAGLLTLLIRTCTNSVEGVVYSIAIVNLISSSIDKYVVGKSNDKLGVKYGVTFGTLAATIAIVTTCAWFANGGKEVNEVNGISRKEYDKLVAATHFDFMDENGYTFSQYAKEVSSELLRENDGLKSAYSIVDKDLNEVAVVYCVGVDNCIDIDYEYDIAKVSAEMYVAYDVTTKKLLDVSFVQVPFFGSFESKVEGGIADYDLANNDILTAEPNTIVSGATYSSKGIQDLLVKSQALFLSQYGE